jgi:hypothetical protein
MALGKKYNDNLELIILKIKSKDEDGKNCEPYFQITKKVNGNWEPQPEKEVTVSGRIVKVQRRVSKFNDEEIARVDLMLKDGNQAFLIELRYTLLGRNIFNSLLSLENADSEVELSLYTNKKGYPAASLRADGELLRWKYSLEELPEPNVVVFKGKEQRDFTPVDNFFDEKLAEWSKNLLGAVDSNQAKGTENENRAGATSGAEVAVGGDDIPF